MNYSILFATSNKHKLREANEVGSIYGIEFIQVKETYPEIRDEDVAKVAEAGVLHVYNIIKKPVVVDDTGLYIKALKGFPGPYSAYVHKKIGCRGILKLMEDEIDRTAVFISAAAYFNGADLKVFRGECVGTITEDMRGPEEFGYDPIFQPLGEQKTFAEDYNTKIKNSHRTRAFKELCEWLTKRGK